MRRQNIVFLDKNGEASYSKPELFCRVFPQILFRLKNLYDFSFCFLVQFFKKNPEKQDK